MTTEITETTETTAQRTPLPLSLLLPLPLPLPLVVQSLGKQFAGHVALADVGFELHPGERVALLGANGAGKSTLLQLLTGLFAPDAGHICIMGHALRTHAPQALAHVGVVFQQPALDLDLSVQANLRFHADLHGLPRAVADARMAQDAAPLGLADQLARPCRELSGGNRRKVELVRALLHRPALLLLDEATTGLDASARAQWVQGLAQLQRQHGVAVLWATHLAEEVAGADRVLQLQQGRLIGSVISAAH